MATRRILAVLTNALIAMAVCACSSIGPPTVDRDRIDYGSAIADSWKQQTLLNIVKLRYGDFPVFLEIAQVIAGYQVESSLGAGFNAANTSNFGPFAFFGGSALAQGKYTDRPTLIYAPLTGNDFLKKLMTPIPPSAVLFMLQSGYAADLVMRIAVNSINGVSNESRRGMSRAADPGFARLAQLLREATARRRGPGPHRATERQRRREHDDRVSAPQGRRDGRQERGDPRASCA